MLFRTQLQADLWQRQLAERGFWLNVVLVAATVLTFLVLIVQSILLWKTLGHSRAATRIQLRAYLRVHSVNVNKSSIKVILTNAGSTPAQNIRAAFRGYRGPKRGFTPPIWELHDAPESSMAQGSTFNQGGDWPSLTPADAAGIAAGDEEWAFILGRIEYVDVFGARCHTDYGFDAPFAALDTPDEALNVTPGFNNHS